MTTFDDREKGFEKKYRQRPGTGIPGGGAAQPHAGRVGRWPHGASRMSEDYAAAVVKSDFEQPGDDDVLRKVTQDLTGRRGSRP